MQWTADWLTAYGTLLLFVVALAVWASDLWAKRRASAWDQAEQISAWEEGELDTEGPNAVVALLNESRNPVYHVVVTLVLMQGSGARDGRQAPEGYQRHLRVLPPGKLYTLTRGDYGGMSRRPAVEVAFTDQAGRHWLRNGEGALRRLKTSPEDHYGLDRPIAWDFPLDHVDR